MLKQYLAELKKVKLLTAEEELSLWQACAEQSRAAHQTLMTAYQPLVFKTALSFRLPEQQTMELIQEGMVGLLEASERYDYQRGVAFSIFALHRIRGRMLDYLRTDLSEKNLSLDAENSQGLAWRELLVSAEVSPSEQVEKMMLQEKITDAMERLTSKEKEVLSGLYLEDLTAADLAKRIDVSLSHVYRLQKKAVRRVRGMLSSLLHDLKE